ncbi:hypothetical protein ACFV3E_44485 [Streptomyces sp. NPDC059718]
MTTRHFARTAALAAAAAALAAALAGCADRDAPRVALPTAPAPSVQFPTAPAPTSIPYELYTHCGIDEALIGSTYFEAVTPLSGGAANPPPDWDNPTQQGTMTLLSPTSAVFTDSAGHNVRFRARVGADDFKHVCQ